MRCFPLTEVGGDLVPPCAGAGVQTLGLPAPTPHPLLAVLSEAELAAVLARPDGAEEYAAWFEEREQLIKNADEEKGDPFRFGFELPHWVEADAELKRLAASERGVGQYVSGGKRATKSERAAKRIVQAAHLLKRGKIWCLQGDIKTSRATQQQLIWKYLPVEVKRMKSRTRHGDAKINYSPDGGFTEEILVMPSGTEVYFLTYNQKPEDYQGWEIGFPQTPHNLAVLAKFPWLHNLGAWADEDMPLNWLNTIRARCSTRNAVWMWTFSTLMEKGITTTIKELLTGAKTVKSRPIAALSPARRYVDDCPPGEMPYVQRVSDPGISVMYFHTDLNPFPPNYENMLALVRGKDEKWAMCDLCGYSEETKGKAFPKFGSLNIVEREQLPAVGTNYMLTDPAGNRNYATLWVRVAPGNPPRYFIYRDWPDKRRYGAWAIPSTGSVVNPDGVRGPAQKPFGFGWVKYKETWRKEEKVAVPPSVRKLLEGCPEWGSDEAREKVREALEICFRPGSGFDPLHRRLIEQAIENAENLEELREPIRTRLIDPRAGRDKKTSAQGATCAIDEFAKPHKDENGKLLSAPMIFLAASGLQIATGLQAINDLLDWDQERPEGLVPMVNEPHLYVARNCEQVIWALENYTDEGGEEGGCKDIVDLLRYMALERLRHVAGGAVKTVGGGSY